MNWTDKIQVFNEDCMVTMSRYEDNYFDLAVVDPPYGLDDKLRIGGNTGVVTFKNLDSSWDKAIPNKSYFDELFRVSKNQIIWGGNYFLDYLGSTRGIIIWDKLKENNKNFSHFEFAWSSFDKMAMKCPFTGNGGFVLKSEDKNRIHSTQKPVSLYRWLFENYSKKGQKIIDTHFGSGSIAIAANEFDLELTGSEIDSIMYKKSLDRFKAKNPQKVLVF